MQRVSRGLRVAAHNGAPEWGGAEIATTLLLAGLQERGHEVVLFYNRELVGAAASAHGLPVRRAPLGGDIALHHALRLARHLRRLRPDVLVVGTFRKLWLASLAARLAGVPVIARIGLSSDVPRNAKYRFVFRRLVDRVITNTHDLRDDYARLLPDAPPPELQAIHKGVRIPEVRVSSDEVRHSLGVPRGPALLGGVGRLVPQKRMDRLVRAFAALEPGPWLVVVGDGPLRGELEALTDRLGVSDRVRFAGHREDVPAIMTALDLLVVSSDRESLANVMLEAMAAGVPVLSTPVSGAREALAADVEGEQRAGAAPGRVVSATVDDLTAAMAELLADPAALRSMGDAAGRRVRTQFDLERMLDEWERALTAVAGLEVPG